MGNRPIPEQLWKRLSESGVKIMMGRRGAVVVALAGLFVTASAVSVSAVVVKTGHFSLSATGVAMTNANYTFYRSESSGKDFNYNGYLDDTAADGYSVFVHAKVAGYGWGPNRNYQGYKNYNLNDPAANEVSTAAVEACTSRGIYPDYCDADDLFNP